MAWKQQGKRQMSEFNLIDENWIRVRKNGYVTEISLAEALMHAEEYGGLCGELPTQDIAILRLLIAIIHTIISRKDDNNQDIEEKLLNDASSCIERWKEIWDNGKFNSILIQEYIELWKNRFWLIDEKRPFFQSSWLKSGTVHFAAKIDESISESKNKPRIFARKSGKYKESLSFSEAARWLVTLMLYDDRNSTKKPVVPKSVGWGGICGMIMAEGKNLFQTIMLNMPMLTGNAREHWNKDKPTWEEEECNEIQKKIPVPCNIAQLFTVQSRRIRLTAEDGKITKALVAAGDYFDASNAFSEPMTLWKQKEEKKGKFIEPEEFIPERHKPEKKAWQEFPSIISTAEDKHIRQPEIVVWIGMLQKKKKLPKDMLIRFKTVGITYDTKEASITSIFSNDIQIFADVIENSDNSIKLQIKIADEVKNCESCASAVGNLASDIAISGGINGKNIDKGNKLLKNKKKYAEFEYYFSINDAFKNWISSINSESNLRKAVDDWHKIGFSLAYKVGERIYRESSPEEFRGRTVKINNKKNEKKLFFCCAPEAYRRFKFKILSIYGEQNYERG